MQSPCLRACHLAVLPVLLALPACTPPRFAAPDGGEASDARHPDGIAARTCTEDDPETPGNDCPQAVYCMNAEDCDVSQSLCCLDLFGLDDQCGGDAGVCGGGRYRASCDGPEDCAPNQACCLEGYSSLCTSGSCNERDRVCHSDLDCTTGHCVEGRIDFTFARWGFCRG